MRCPSWLLTSVTACALAACASASGTNLPDPITTGALPVQQAAVPTGERVGYLGSGRYVLTDDEKNYDCLKIDFAVGTLVKQINALPDQARTQQEGPPPSVLRAIQRLQGRGIPAFEDFKRHMARAKALAQSGLEKKCTPSDVDTLTKPAADRMAALRAGHVAPPHH